MMYDILLTLICPAKLLSFHQLQWILLRSKQQKPAESETATEPTTKDKAEKTDSSSKPKPTDRAAKEASPVATKEKGAAEGMSEVAKETTFVSPTEEEINQLCQPEKEGEAKKKE